MTQHISTDYGMNVTQLPHRDAIDQVATLRARVVRVALNVSILSAGLPEAEAEDLRKELAMHTKTIAHTLQVLKGHEVFENLPEQLSHWLASIAKTKEELMPAIREMVDMTTRINQKIQSGGTVSADELKRYVVLGQKDFFQAVSMISAAFWQQIENTRQQQIEVATHSAQGLERSLSRLERIGKYVRQMSINASIEASRAGEAGKGLAVIAQEFKTLAEEVQQLAISARGEIDKLEGS